MFYKYLSKTKTQTGKKKSYNREQTLIQVFILNCACQAGTPSISQDSVR